MPFNFDEKQKTNKKISLKMKKFYRKLKNEELVKVAISSDDEEK